MCRFRGRHSTLYLHVQISWQVQYFVNLHVQISWQAQHFVNLHASPNLDGEAPRNDGFRMVLRHGRIMVGSVPPLWLEFSLDS